MSSTKGNKIKDDELRWSWTLTVGFFYFVSENKRKQFLWWFLLKQLQFNQDIGR